MSFTDQKQRAATEQECNARWNGDKPGRRFRCYLCGKKFVVGDLWRFVFDNVCGNFLVCDKCDGEDVKTKWANHNEIANTYFWWKENYWD